MEGDSSDSSLNSNNLLVNSSDDSGEVDNLLSDLRSLFNWSLW